jgi:hypothetical protein
VLVSSAAALGTQLALLAVAVLPKLHYGQACTAKEAKCRAAVAQQCFHMLVVLKNTDLGLRLRRSFLQHCDCFVILFGCIL